MNGVDKQYLELLNKIIEEGRLKEDRTGTGTLSIFDHSIVFDMSEGFPLLTSKKVFTKGVIHELIWFLSGDTNIKYLVDNDVHIWDGDAYKSYQQKMSFGRKMQSSLSDPNNLEILTKEEFINKIKTDDDFAKKWGELGPVYGKQWRSWDGWDKIPSGWHHNTITNYRLEPKGDQISKLIHDLKNDPDSRRLMVSAWNVSDLEQMVLPPCHFGFQCYTYLMTDDERKLEWVKSLNKDISYADKIDIEFLDKKNFPKRKLDLKWFQRSVDSFLGLPFNISSYGILLHLLAKETNMIPNKLIFNGGDCHIYTNHINQCKLQMTQETYQLPKLVLKNNSIFDLKFEDIEIVDYISSPTIKASLSN
jgi:thymidylate synthase